MNFEVGMVNWNFLGRKIWYVYLVIVELWFKVFGFVKVDFLIGEVKNYFYGDKKYGGEFFFLFRGLEFDGEDDGYIMLFVYDEEGWKLEF